jgi:hypothetical protein
MNPRHLRNAAEMLRGRAVRFGDEQDAEAINATAAEMEAYAEAREKAYEEEQNRKKRTGYEASSHHSGADRLDRSSGG